MLIYFLTILQNDQRRTSDDIQSADSSREKASEKITAQKDDDLVPVAGSLYIHTAITNDGSLPGVVKLSALYCTTCGSPSDPVIADESTDATNYAFTLNAEDS